MTENEISRHVVDVSYQAHLELGPGLLESVYQAVLAMELQRRGLLVTEQQLIPVVYKGIPRLSDKRLGLLINFNVARIKDGITRIANGLEE